jgi:CHAD domain-containing protein
MVTPFEQVEKNAHQFMAGLHTMQEILKSLNDHEHATEMIEACSRHKDLEPGIADFQEEIDEIESFWLTVANIYSIVGQLES